MHIPDGMLQAPTWIPAWLGSVGVLAWAAREVRKRLSDGTIVMMAVFSALVFALQMLNFPVAGGTSGHFSGGAAAAIVLGLWPAMLVMAAVVTVQAVFFADGGITTLGANLMTMAVVGPLAGHLVYRMLARFAKSRTARVASSFVSAWTACLVAALAAGSFLWLSDRAPLGAALGAMGLWHALIGLGEGAITAGLVSYLLAVRPDLISDHEHPADTRTSRAAVVGLAALALVAAGISFIASSHPDGLEFVYERIGSAFAAKPVFSGAMPEYLIPGMTNETLAGILAGIVGVVITGALVYALLSSARLRRVAEGDER